MRIKLGELLLKARVISEQQLQTAIGEQDKWGGKLGTILVRMGYLTEDLLTKALSKQLGIPRVDLDKSQPAPLALRKVKVQTAEDYGILPIELQDDGATLVVAMSDPQNVRALDEIKAATGCRRVIPYLAGESDVRRHIGRAYASTDLREDGGGDEFKVVDAQGRTVMKAIGDIMAEGRQQGAAKAPPPPVAAAPAPPPPPVAARPTPPTPADDDDPLALLKRLERTQRKEVQALKAIVDLLIERGVFGRDDYLAKVGRR